MDAQGGRERREEEKRNENSLHEESHVLNRHLTWWQNAWWVRVNSGPHMRTAKGRRGIWRAARQAAELACSEEWVGVTQGEEGEKDGEKREEKETGTRNSSGSGGSGSSSASPLRSWSGLGILRLARRCPMSTSLLWKISQSCISTSASETSPNTCSDSLRKDLNKVQPIIELGFHSSAVEDGPNQCATVLRGRPLELEVCESKLLR